MQHIVSAFITKLLESRSLDSPVGSSAATPLLTERGTQKQEVHVAMPAAVAAKLAAADQGEILSLQLRCRATVGTTLPAMDAARGAAVAVVAEAQRRLAAAADRADLLLYRHTAAWRPWQVALGSLLTAWLLSRVLAAVLRQWGLIRDKGEASGVLQEHCGMLLLSADEQTTNM